MMDATELMGGPFDEFFNRHKDQGQDASAEFYDLDDLGDFDDIDGMDDHEDPEDFDDNDESIF